MPESLVSGCLVAVWTRLPDAAIRPMAAEAPPPKKQPESVVSSCCVKIIGWCPKKYADIKRQANNDISIVQNFLLKQRNLANLNY